MACALEFKPETAGDSQSGERQGGCDGDDELPKRFGAQFAAYVRGDSPLRKYGASGKRSFENSAGREPTDVQAGENNRPEDLFPNQGWSETDSPRRDAGALCESRS